MKGNSNALQFEELVSILLQEEQSWKNMSVMCTGGQVFVVNYKGKCKSSFQSGYKPRLKTFSTFKDRDGDKKKKGKCNYCKK